MAHDKDKKQKEILEALIKATGNVSVACAKTGISRATFYVWINEDEKFNKEASTITEDQKRKMDDFADGLLKQHIKEGNITCLIFYLKTRHLDYRMKLALEGKIKTDREMTEEEKALLKKALEHAGLPKD